VMAGARLKDAGDLEYVKDEIIKTYESFITDRVSDERLAAVKSHLRYAFALGLDNSSKIAATVAAYAGVSSTPETINRLFDVYQSTTPEDIQAMANRYFAPEHRAIVSLQHKRS
jgi:zinc protease